MAKVVTVTQSVVIDVKPEAFTPEFMSEFAETMYPFDTLDQHIEHLAQLAARGILAALPFYDGRPDWIEGYGPAHEFLNSIGFADTETVIEDDA